MKKTKVVLPANVFDALHLSALAAGGVGSGCLNQDEVKKGVLVDAVPVCIIGHALFLDDYKVGQVTKTVAKAFGFDAETYSGVFEKNDVPLIDYLTSTRGSATDYESKQLANGEFCSLNTEKKVSWKAWCRIVGVERGK